MDLKNTCPICSSNKIAGAALGVLIILAIFLVAMTAAKIFDTRNAIREGRYIGQDRQYKNTIVVSGEGKTFAKPDIGEVTVSVLSQASTVALAQKDNIDKMNAVTKAIKDLGVKEEDLKTTNYQVNPRYQYNLGRSTIIGYEVRQSLQVKIRELDKAPQILEKATSSGANEVSSLNFTIDDQDKVKNEARKEAIAKAKAKAQELAASLGVNLGKIVSFSENYGATPYPLYYESSAKIGMGGSEAAPDIQAGQNEVNAGVSITYEIY
ncbi:MAG: hypothetical protein UV34_C0052G0008 [Parcubacteria group bacterium GW2011_GWB1_42_6]|nr:MAG: hypothetical protein UV34_C0052G0008 [Parcubacteria group bacterium GW2011_GWB1_42_6]